MVPGGTVNKEGLADSLLRYEKTTHYRFSWKMYFLLWNLLLKFTLFIEWHLCLYIYWSKYIYLLSSHVNCIDSLESLS